MTPVAGRQGRERCSHEFESLARVHFSQTSPLYFELASAAQHDEWMLDLALEGASDGQVLLLLGAVHFLLFAGDRHPLRAFYPSVCSPAAPPVGVWPVFKEFCRERCDELRSITKVRRVQTNEVARCSGLLPAICVAARLAPGRRLGVIDLGASAGLNLLFDRYAYDYGSGLSHLGDPRSPLTLGCRLQTGSGNPDDLEMPVVTSRLGIDLNPLDLSDADAVAWLRALIWPEQIERAARLEAAVAIAGKSPPTIWSGDAADLLPAALASMPLDAVPCVLHSLTVYQLSGPQLADIDRALNEAGAQRANVCIGMEPGSNGSALQIDMVRRHRGRVARRRLGSCGPHGDWLAWSGERQ